MKRKRQVIFIQAIFLIAFVSISHAGQDMPDASDVSRSGGVHTEISGPVAEAGSDQGELFGDLFVILRYRGGEEKKIPRVDDNGDPVYVNVEFTDPAGNTFTAVQQAWDTGEATGGEPVLTESFVPYTMTDEDTGEFVPNPETGDIWYAAPTPSRCVQPVAGYERWGNISSKTGLDRNRIPLSMVYDPTWDRTECDVGMPTIYPEGAWAVDPWFIEPGMTWTDPVNGEVTYTEGVLWTDLVEEVSFGRMNVGRSPDAVLNASFDEAVRSINSAVAVELDAAGRLLLTREVYSEFEVDPGTGKPMLLGTVKKAIDSPLENLALYVKLLSDGHLVTPGDERAPLDRSELGGIPLSRMLELSDGPSDALRPTIDIEKLRQWGLGHLADVTEETYYTYFEVTYDHPVTCVPVDRVLHATPVNFCATVEFDVCGQPVICAGPFTGILSADDGIPAGDDFTQSASFFAAAADKTGDVGVDMLVYLNSILGLNKVTGYSAYDEDGKPAPDAVDYTASPLYYDFQAITGYSRENTFRYRGDIQEQGGNYTPSTYTGTILVLQPYDEGWRAHATVLLGNTCDSVAVNNVDWHAVLVDWDSAEQQPVYTFGEDNIHGFAQMADDDLNVIEFVHTYQIPELR